VKNIVFIIAISGLLLIIAGCSYEDEVRTSAAYSHGCASPDGRQIVFARSYKLFRQAAGVNAFPDGGQPEYLHNTLTLYLYDTATTRVRKLAEVHGRPAASPPQVKLSWQGDNIAYWVVGAYNRGDKNEGIFIVDVGTGEQRLLVQDGEMPAISPDGEQIIYQRRLANETFELRQIAMTGDNERLLTRVDSGKLVFADWENSSAIHLYLSLDGGFRVDRYSLVTRVQEITDLPYVRNYGNLRVHPLVAELNANVWEMPLAPE